jgi:hypothetical protein
VRHLYVKRFPVRHQLSSAWSYCGCSLIALTNSCARSDTKWEISTNILATEQVIPRQYLNHSILLFFGEFDLGYILIFSTDFWSGRAEASQLVRNVNLRWSPVKSVRPQEVSCMEHSFSCMNLRPFPQYIDVHRAVSSSRSHVQHVCPVTTSTFEGVAAKVVNAHFK